MPYTASFIITPQCRYSYKPYTVSFIITPQCRYAYKPYTASFIITPQCRYAYKPYTVNFITLCSISVDPYTYHTLYTHVSEIQLGVAVLLASYKGASTYYHTEPGCYTLQ